MAERAKSVSCEELAKTGSKVADFLRSERTAGLSESRIAFFPDYGIFGGEVALRSVADLNLGEVAKMSGRISAEILAATFDVTTAVTIRDDILIFGGEVGPVGPLLSIGQ